jgi:hypothetical protein
MTSANAGHLHVRGRIGPQCGGQAHVRIEWVGHRRV